MAPTAPAATGAASPAAPAVAKGEGKGKAAAAARSVGLDLPALPPLPGLGLGLALQGQTRAASCRRPERNVVAMAAAGETAAPVAANEEIAEEITEFVNALKQEWNNRIENKFAAVSVAVAATLGMWSAGGVVSAIDRLPVVPGMMEVVGIGYSAWFTYRNMLFKPDRDAFFGKVMEFYEDIISG